MTQPSAALAIRDLHKTYANGHVALRGVSLRVAEGDFYALLGPNGAGKSTLIGIVCSLVNKSSGQVEVFGHDMDSEMAAAKACIGVVPQEFNFNMFEQVLDIIVNQAGYYGIERHTALDRAADSLRRLGLWDKRRTRARDLSGGMKRRLMIARALVHRPRLLILDEPTAGVDIELRRSMWTFLRETNANGTTIILTTHYLEEAESLCKNIAIIDEGRFVEDTDMKTLINTLSMETLVLDLAAPLTQPLDLPGYTVRVVDATTIEVDVRKEQGLNGLFVSLSRQGIEAVSLRNKTNRLEELFLSLTGGEALAPRPATEPEARRAAS